MSAPSPAQAQVIQQLDLGLLLFDPENPRFSAFETSTDAEVISRMTETENVQELMGSIGEQGYFHGEPLLVAPEDPDGASGKYIVVEGNRRLAALKLLAGSIGSDKPSIAALRESARHRENTAPCLIFPKRRDVLRYLGYRHITGAKRWEPLPKARYLKQLKDEFYSDLSAEDQFRTLAKEIGSRADYVAQMLTGLEVYDRASAKRFYDLNGVNEASVDFSLLTTALSYSAISAYVGLKSKADLEGPLFSDDHCRDLFYWMYSPQEDGFTILGESRKLRTLAAVLTSTEAVENLKETRDLDRAFLLSEGPTRALEKVLNLVLVNLESAYALVPDAKNVNDSHLNLIARADDLVQDLRSSVRRRIRDKGEDA